MVESDLTLISTVGLDNPLRESTIETIESLHMSGTQVRIFSGDHRASVIQLALEAEVIDRS